jgi:hypothetical protein
MVLMSSPASSSEGRRKSNWCSSPGDRVVIAFALAIAVLPWIASNDEQQHVTPITTELRSSIDSDVIILSVEDADTAVLSCPVGGGKFRLALLELVPPAFDLAPLLTLPQKGQEMLDTMSAAWASIGNVAMLGVKFCRILLPPIATLSDCIRRTLRSRSLDGSNKDGPAQSVSWCSIRQALISRLLHWWRVATNS